jgi:hypothetical protein
MQKLKEVLKKNEQKVSKAKLSLDIANAITEVLGKYNVEINNKSWFQGQVNEIAEAAVEA